MAQIASEDYPNKLIYLHIDTVTLGFDPAEMQKEHRTLRRLNAGGERKFDPMVSFTGNEDKGGGKKTPRSTRLRAGVRIVPYDTGAATQYTMGILNEILNVPDGLADQAVFDRSTVAANVDIDKAYDPVEVITVATGSGVTEQDKLDIANRVWIYSDRQLTSFGTLVADIWSNATRSLTTFGTLIADIWSYTTRLLTGSGLTAPEQAQLTTIEDNTNELIKLNYIVTGFCVSSTANKVVLGVEASTVNGAYDPAMITIVAGTGAGQTRLILEYVGVNRTCVVDRNWKTQPDATSEYVVTPHPGREHINEGLITSATANTAVLNYLASDADEAYTGQVLCIRSGPGEDQSLRVIAYDGTTKTVTLCEDWAVIPGPTSAYVMLPSSVLKKDQIADAVWDKVLP